jgi:2-methylisocitrate lyase-like PEP mutase family enzyme
MPPGNGSASTEGSVAYGGFMTEFRALHRPGRPFVLPNAWDVASAAALARAGFRAIGTTSLGVAAAAGIRDGEGASKTETLALVGRLASVDCLLTVDIEGGFSDDPAEVAALVGGLAELGVVGVNIEDGRADGTLRPVHLHASIIAAVKRVVPEMFVNARTDTWWLRVAQDRTAERLAAYADAGADGVFVPGLSEPSRIAAVVAAVDRPLNVLYPASGPSLRQLADAGVARVSTGSLLFRVGLQASVDAALAAREGRPVTASAPTYVEANDLSG